MMRPALARWCLVVMFAAGMAWVEAASVYYLRVMVDRIEPYQMNPLPMHGVLGPVEVVREVATLVMLLVVGMLAARTWARRLGYTAIAFGVWDILYYVFLKIICDWPKSIFDWDILFLLPLPWWGPVLAPVCIASLMVVWGTLATQFIDGPPGSRTAHGRWPLLGLGGLGIALALSVFMVDSLRTVTEGRDVRDMLPGPFNWPVFCVALACMAMPVAQTGWRILNRAIDIGVDSEYIRPRRNYSRIAPEPHAETEKH